MEAIWTPQPKQALMMARPEYEALYGGAAGGGKTDYLVIEALRQVHIPHYKALILRRTFPQLKEIIDKAYLYYPKAFPDAKYNKTEHRWTFPSGAKIDFGSLNSEEDKYKYQGIAYDFIGFDELTHFTATQYEYLKSRNRANGAGTIVYTRATANPGGIGHGWVKDRFVTSCKAGETKVEVHKVKTAEGIEYRAQSRVYIPASVFDNKKLLDNNPKYVTHLAALPEAEGIYFDKGDHERLAGLMIKGWFKTDEGWNYLGEDGVYDALRSSFPFHDKNRIEIVE